ncbi:MAG TPA: hypothetical protein PK141_15310 [Polyangiaceae bacterium]|nr:hypothetical protein [Polyangiaceae bacterium]
MTRACAFPVAVLAAALACAAVGAEKRAFADEPKPRSTLLQRARASSDLLDTAPTIAAVEGTWSIMLQAGTLMSTRAWLGPYPRGLAAHVATRALYGTTWSVMLASETLLALTVSGGSFAWLGEAHYRADQLFGVGVPAGCGSFGANGGCGVGLGGFAGLHARLSGSPVWVEVSGGWIQQRVGTDAQRTLGESTWVMTPIGITAEGVVNRGGAVELRATGGPHLQFGMHNGHVHPTALGDETLSVPWTELFPMHMGLGPGARAEVRLVLGQRVSLDLEGVFTPLLLSSTEEHPRAVLAPLGPTAGQGLPTWRRLAIGASYIDRAVRVGLSFFGAELSGRPVTTLGHQAIALRLDFPLGLDSRESRR